MDVWQYKIFSPLKELLLLLSQPWRDMYRRRALGHFLIQTLLLTAGGGSVAHDLRSSCGYKQFRLHIDLAELRNTPAQLQ